MSALRVRFNSNHTQKECLRQPGLAKNRHDLLSWVGVFLYVHPEDALQFKVLP
jgi:hypothetical protein